MSKKEICYLLQKNGADSKQMTERKEQLIRQGYLVVTVIEGPIEMQKGLQAVVQNHGGKYL